MRLPEPSILTHFSHPVHLINPVIRYHVRPPLDPQAPIKLARQAVTLTLRTGLLPRVFVVAGNPLAAILNFPSLVVCKLAVIESLSAGCWSLPVVGLCDRSNSRILSGEKITTQRGSFHQSAVYPMANVRSQAIQATAPDDDESK